MIAEAHANGIPAIASTTPGLSEAVGPGGILVDMDDIDGWADAVRQLWENQQAYSDLSDRARAHSNRDEIDPHQIAEAFERIMDDAVKLAASTQKAAAQNIR